MLHINANLVVAIAEEIARHDVSATVSNRVLPAGSKRNPHPWYITVDDSGWKRNLELVEHNHDGTDATFAILSEDGEVVERITLSELTARGYNGIREALYCTVRA